ncbi:hypothetical protein HY745_01350 [Candidatus Desantisbacteria bacterium]|nr:hypothetical protein [Candidatus Desantisbacteria bacterium]
MVVLQKRIVETCHGMSLQQRQQQTNNNQFSKPKKNSLSMVINHYKGTIKRYCNKNNIVFAWQSRFYDHIIRDEKELYRIKEYIISNPYNWNNDKLFDRGKL